jgi:DNA-directed RNA polymerase subunit RPC12/RpoP
MERIEGGDNYEAWEGRGDLVSATFWCEFGHSFSLNFGSHKGATICFWEYVAEHYSCSECYRSFEGKPGERGLHTHCPDCEKQRGLPMARELKD